ncbi:MAG TPA: hypothetical protein VH589_23790 [Trebonia sp.]|jgi:hypothetical protein
MNVTDLRKLAVPAFGVATLDQVLPFQRSMSGVVADGMPGPGPTSPTAQALERDVAATA